MGLACTWALAAVMSERVLGLSFAPPPRAPRKMALVHGTLTRLAPKETNHLT